MQLLLDYHGNPYLENDQGLTPIDVCKNPEILSLLREERAPREEREHAREDSEEAAEEEEDVFVTRDKTVGRVRDSHLKTGSKGSSRSSADSICEEKEGEIESGLYRDADEVCNTPNRVMGKKFSHTPKSRPRNILYSEPSSSGSDSEPPGKLGGRKVRYHLAKMGEAKQKLLGKLEESGELESGHVRGPEVTQSEGCGKEDDSETSEDNEEGT